MPTLLSRSLMWLFAEIVLTLVNLDNLADYGEFIFRVKDDLALQRDRVERVLHTDNLDQLAYIATTPMALV